MKISVISAVFLVIIISTAFLPTSLVLAKENPNCPAEKINLINEIKEFQKKFGIAETNNFKTYNAKQTAYHFFYYTKKTTLPYSYEDSRLLYKEFSSRPDDPKIDQTVFEIFYSPTPAIAGIGGTPITPAMCHASLQLIAEIVSHEDFHDQFDRRENIPAGIEEPMAFMVGLLVAKEFIKAKYGEMSPDYKKIEETLKYVLATAPIYIKYHELLKRLYDDNYHEGELSYNNETISRKEKLLEAMKIDFLNLGKKEERLNNAFIALQMTYYRHFPSVYEVYLDKELNLKETIEIFKKVLLNRTNSTNKMGNMVEAIKEAEQEILHDLKVLLKEEKKSKIVKPREETPPVMVEIKNKTSIDSYPAAVDKEPPINILLVTIILAVSIAITTKYYLWKRNKERVNFNSRRSAIFSCFGRSVERKML